MLESFLENEEELLLKIARGMLCTGLAISVIFPIFNLVGEYGRYADKAPKWMPRGPAKILWMIQESPSLLVPWLLLVFSHDPHPLAYIGVAMMVVHYFHRVFVYNYLTRNPTPYGYHVVVCAFAFSLINGYLQGRYHLAYAQNEPMTLWRMVGLLTWFAGFAMNFHYDHSLIQLRHLNETDYKIPYGGLFKYVSCPNFLAECIEWFGYALFCNSLPALAFAVFSSCNLGATANCHHKFYLGKFEDYPKNRKRMIPYIF